MQQIGGNITCKFFLNSPHSRNINHIVIFTSADSNFCHWKSAIFKNKTGLSSNFAIFEDFFLTHFWSVFHFITSENNRRPKDFQYVKELENQTISCVYRRQKTKGFLVSKGDRKPKDKGFFLCTGVTKTKGFLLRTGGKKPKDFQCVQEVEYQRISCVLQEVENGNIGQKRVKNVLQTFKIFKQI